MHLKSSEDAIGPAVRPVDGAREDVIELTETGKGAREATIDVPNGNVGMDQAMERETAKPRSKIRNFAVLAGLFATLFIVALNTTIVTTALPTIVSSLGSASGYSWIGGAYVLANGAAAPVWAKLSDIWGRKIILLTAVALYFASSILCALSTSMRMLIIGRSFQGTAGGGLAQLVNITIGDLYSMRERSLYFGLLELMWAAAGGIGPVLGGVFSQYVSWRFCFWLNLPISFVTFMLLFFFLDVHNPKTPLIEGIKAVDWFGSLSILGFMVMLLLGLDFGGTIFPWNSPTVICLIVFGCVMSLFFVFSEKKLAKYPIMPLGIFCRKGTIACLAVAFAHEFAVIASEYYLPLYFQSVTSASPVRSGLLLLPLVLTEAFTGIATGLIIHQTGSYIPLIRIGIVLMTLGCGLYIDLSPTTSVGAMVGFMIIFGLGAGLLFQPPLIAIQAAVPQEDNATATASLGFSRNISLALSIVLGGVVFQNGMNRGAASLSAAGLPPEITMLLTGENAAANVDIVSKIADPKQQEAVKAAFAWSLRNMWILYASVSACGIVASAFTVHTVLSEVHVETKTGLRREKEEVVAMAGSV